MPYEKPTIDESGLHIPLYTDVRDDLLQQARQIFGEDIYLDADSQDYQLIAEFCDKWDDIAKLLQMVYNNRGPSTAVGSGLDGLLKINGLKRKEEGHSQALLTLTGEPGLSIYGGIVKDKPGNLWSVANCKIGDDGTVEDVLATCQTPGAVYADVGTISKITTQKNGWFSVTNPANAMVGQAAETDAKAKARQSISTAKPSKTVLLGTMGGIAEIADVLRSKVYENDTNVFGYYGVPIPEHSICAVVEGGEEQAIADEIYLRKGPGCGTYGDVEVPIESPDPTLDTPPPIKFYRPTYVDVMVQVTISPKTGYLAETGETMLQNIVEYLNALDIGTDLTVSALYVPAQSATPDIHAPLFSIQELLIGTSADDLSRNDMTIAFNQVTRGVADNVQIVVL
ncbi:hypothetical protein LJC32_06920 [Oscillospiraceae bacterium OttesenSCG-928-F05]|nr:hypothetical protein [Oscillospiraceae bacterium OttesenSCG-928-F05]